jgi:ubiquinone/menaquinone biosynthesis C-methylase UbiE
MSGGAEGTLLLRKVMLTMPTNQSGQDVVKGGTGEEAAAENRVPVGADERLRGEFDRWPKDGRAQQLESDHLYVTERTMLLMDLKPGERVLDLSCGSGWATRLLARRVSQDQQAGQVVGIDISGEMVSLARESSREFSNIEYIQASAESIPLEPNRFDEILSVEAFYYYPDQDRALDEIYRVLAPGGRLFILINVYRDNPSCEYWTTHLPVDAHFRSATEYVQLLQAHGFAEVTARQIPNRWQPAGGYVGAVTRVLKLFLSPPQMWIARLSTRFRGAKQAHDTRRAGSLLLIARKPAASVV